MPTVKLLRTTVGGYEFINLTSDMIASFLRKVDLSVQVDGVRLEFCTGTGIDNPIPYVGGTLEVMLAGVEQNGVMTNDVVPVPVLTEHPGLGTFTLSFIPDPSMHLPMIVRYVIA